MSDARALARLWAGGSVFEPGAARADGAAPFGLVAAGAAAGREGGRAPSALPPRCALGLKAMPPLRVPLLLDAAGQGEVSQKGFAALARGAASAGTGLVVAPTQLKQRETVLKASGVPLVLQVEPGDALSPAEAAAAAALAPVLASGDGAPALLAADALGGLVESLRALTQYRAPVVLVCPPGRAPPASAIRDAAAAGAAALCFSSGAGPLRLPFAALAGAAVGARAAQGGLASFLSTDAVTDGIELACALALGNGLACASLPARLTLSEEAATDADWKATGDRLGQALRVLWEDAQRASGAVGVRDPRDLSPENLRALTFDAAALSGLPLAGFDERLPWWSH